ncbi:MAG: tyrosine-type recombinase/integrase [Pseudolabrys sp.]|nr:tyrosine-type recombinase/integrase [Pseudolabrys sp.]
MKRVGRGVGSIWQTRESGPWYAWAYSRDAGDWVRRSTKTKTRSVALNIASQWLRDGEMTAAGFGNAPDHVQRPILEHLEDFAKANRLDPHGFTARHINRKLVDIKAMIAMAGWTKITDITLEGTKELFEQLRLRPMRPEPVKKPVKVQKEGAKVRTSKKSKPIKKERPTTRSPRTLNLRRAYVKNFTNWLRKKGRIAHDPLADFSHFRTDGFERVKRRPLSTEEQRRLIAAAESSGVIEGISGPDRAMLYVCALATGFRKAECGSLTPASFFLDAKHPTVLLSGEHAKDKQALPALRKWLSGRDRSRPLWPGLLEKNPAGFVASDLERAKITIETDLGKVDFHALRHTFGTMLARAGVKPQECMRLMRHKDINLTLKYYTHLSNEDLARAIDRGYDASSTARVAKPRSTGAAVTTEATGTVGRPQHHEPSAAHDAQHHEEEADMHRPPPSTGEKTQWAERDSNPRLDDYESRLADSESTVRNGVSAAPTESAALAQQSTPKGAEERTKKRGSARDRADAGLAPDIEQAFDHIAALGSLATRGNA